MADEVEPEVAGTEQEADDASTEQRETAETVETETPTEQAATEAKAESTEAKPNMITREEAEKIAAEAVANLQRQYDAKLQANAHNAKLAEVLEGLKDQMSGKKPVDPNAMPEGFEALPDGVARFTRDLSERVRAVEAAEANARERAVTSSVDAEVLRRRADPTEGKLFSSVEDAISEDIKRNPEIWQWMRRDPKECLDTLYAKHARGKTAQVTNAATKAKVEVAKSVSQRPSQATTSSPVSKPDAEVDFDAAFEKTWNEKLGAGKNYVDQT